MALAGIWLVALGIFVEFLIVAPLFKSPTPLPGLEKGAINSGILLNFDISTSTPGGKDTAVNSTTPRLIIPKIGVNMPIIVGETSEKKALAKGAWLIPGTAEPGSGGYNNTVISAHRYLYTSGPRTFFFLDKLEEGDNIYISWKGKDFVYTVTDKQIVSPSTVSILQKTQLPVLTLFTCHPVYSTKERLVIRAIQN